MNMSALWYLLTAVPALQDVSKAIPDAVIDLRYATADNFMKKQVYPAGARCLLLEPSLARLLKAAEALRKLGFRLRLYDCYRPHSVQYKLWQVMPVQGYVANPKTGSNHNRGVAVDLSLVTLDGHEVEMPSPYDDFTAAAHHGYQDATAAAIANRETLRQAMQDQGFTLNRMEWWHFDSPGAKKFPLRNESFDETNVTREAP
jgi:zinc D-Ala-D-Ala dipeptidase